jgi:hypothetical protein
VTEDDSPRRTGRLRLTYNRYRDTVETSQRLLAVAL